MNGYPVQQSSTTQGLRFLLVSSTDHISPVTGASPTVTLCKQGQTSFSAPAGAVAELGNGWYHVAPNATDNNTLGPLTLHATATGADPTDWQFQVVGFNPLSATNLGLSALPAASPGASGGLPACNSSGNAPADLQTIKAQAVTCSGGVTIPAATLASTTNITAATGITLASSQTFSTSGSVGSVAGSVASVTAAVTLPSIPTNWITATGIAASALNGKGDWLLSSSYSAPPTSSAIATASAAAILVTPFNKLATGLAGGAQLDLTQAVPTSNTAQTIGDSLNAARAQGFGKWTLVGTTLTLYAPDGTTSVRTFALDSAVSPTQRS